LDVHNGPSAHGDYAHLRQRRHAQIGGGIALDGIKLHVAGDNENEGVCNTNCHQQDAYCDPSHCLSFFFGKVGSTEPEGCKHTRHPEIDEGNHGYSSSAIRSWGKRMLAVRDGHETSNGNTNIYPGDELRDDEDPPANNGNCFVPIKFVSFMIS
jgi:hypothetical protein